MKKDPDVVAAVLKRGCGERYVDISKEDILTNPVVAAHVLAHPRIHRTSIYDKVYVDKDTMLDIIARDASVLKNLVQAAKLKSRKQLAVWETAADELVQDNQFMINCVKRNWRAASYVSQRHPHLSKKAWAAAFGFFGPAKFAAYYCSKLLAVEGERDEPRFVFAHMLQVAIPIEAFDIAEIPIEAVFDM